MSTPVKKSKAALKREPQLQPQEKPGEAVEETEGGIIVISQAGDVVLAVERESNTDETCMYRVESRRLKEASAYFKRLLDTDFEEGTAVAQRHEELRSKYATLDTAPANELPRVNIVHVGRISPVVKSIRQLMVDFLGILHGRDFGSLPPLANVANLVIVADRFDCLAALRQYCKSRKLIAALDAKTSEKNARSLPEEKVRQRLLIGMFLDNPSWVYQASMRLIHKGWIGRESDQDAALWWDLPMGVEDELLFRRDCILETIQSLQTHFLTLYTSRERQCKLGYDTSAECDLYQLGQMFKFFKRIGTTSLQGIIFAEEPPEPYPGDILDLVDSFRTAPEYQIDKNHAHCGLRARIMPLLDLITLALGEVGICWWCWQECRHEYAWSKVKRPLLWKKDSVGAGIYHEYKIRQAHTHLFKHLDTRQLFMATERIWI